MKRFFSIFIICSLMLCLTGCFNNEKQDVLLKYINEDMKELSVLETDLLNNYQNVLADNGITDQSFYNSLTTEIIVSANNLRDKANKVTENISDEKLLEVHKLYVTYTDTLLVSFNLYAEGAKDSNLDKANEASEKMLEAVEISNEYKTKLNELATEYDVELAWNN